MDRRRAGKLGGAAVALLLLSAQSGAGGPPIRALAWLDPDGALTALTSEPADSPAVADPGGYRRAGEALFHSPTLLGGQAARKGISCASCHVGGHDNVHFRFPGVSGAPGTADVTHSFFSSRRSDGVFNPVPIPDLGAPGKISRTDPGALEAFMRGLIVEEFDGEEPGASTLAALAVYVRAIGPRAGDARQPVTADLHGRRAVDALAAAGDYAATDAALADRLLGAARAQLGLIDERYAGEGLAKDRAAVTALSRRLAMLQQDPRSKQGGFDRRHRAAVTDLAALRKRLAASQDRSLYDPGRLRSALVSLSR